VRRVVKTRLSRVRGYKRTARRTFAASSGDVGLI
jgi:hypothetical protein